jgi:hypothetical protein
VCTGNAYGAVSFNSTGPGTQGGAFCVYLMY